MIQPGNDQSLDKLCPRHGTYPSHQTEATEREPLYPNSPFPSTHAHGVTRRIILQRVKKKLNM